MFEVRFRNGMVHIDAFETKTGGGEGEGDGAGGCFKIKRTYVEYSSYN